MRTVANRPVMDTSRSGKISFYKVDVSANQSVDLECGECGRRFVDPRLRAAHKCKRKVTERTDAILSLYS